MLLSHRGDTNKWPNPGVEEVDRLLVLPAVPGGAESIGNKPICVSNT